MVSKKEEFIRKAKLTHPGKYDYSKVEYLNSLTKVLLTCPVHGDFLQLPATHIAGSGCIPCGLEIAKNKRKTTLDGFIQKAKAMHGDRYDYSKVDYVNNYTKITIVCPKHGDFLQVPSSHSGGKGCYSCGKELAADKIKLTQEMFIQKAADAHFGKYDYAKSVYQTGRGKVTITCPTHGDFLQLADSHLSGNGCPLCGSELRNRKNTRSTKDFISRSRVVHGHRYDYSKVDYVNSLAKVTITCPKHGDFSQLPGAHQQGVGCFRCGVESRILPNTSVGVRFKHLRSKVSRTNPSKITKETFIQRSHAIHGGRYDYSKSHYIDRKTHILIICPEHGEFKQLPPSHLNGMGCAKCSKVAQLTTKEWVRRAVNVHGDRYDYSEVDYINAKVKVKIICKKHGLFLQIPGNHTSGKGCLFCTKRVITNTSELIERAKEVHGDRYDYHCAKWVGLGAQLVIGCKLHGNFSQTTGEHLQGAGCSSCSNSRGETAIRNILLKHNVEFTQEYRIPDLQYRFRYDFYLPVQKLLIEFHGEQHYRPIAFFGGEEAFNKTKLRDASKRFLAKELKYNLIEINYKVFDKLPPEEFEQRLLRNINKFNSK